MTAPVVRRFEARLARAVALPWLEYAPAGQPPPNGWPLVLYLHGAGEKGDGLAAVRASPLPALLEKDLRPPMLVACPQCPLGPGWPIDALAALLDHLVAHDDVDRDAVHLVGISMGARGAWEFAYAHADRPASLVAVAGFGIPTLAPLVANIPAWLFHGAEDAVVPAARSRDMAEALAAAGANVRIEALPGEGHDCGAAVFARRDLWSWLTEQRRRKGEA